MGATSHERLAVCGLVSTLLLLAGAAASGSASIVPNLFLGAAALLAVSALFSVVAGWEAAAARYCHADVDVISREGLEAKIEDLEDLRWQARDDANHLQAMLDSQDAWIVRRNQGGTITFANRAFCAAFSVPLAEIINKPLNVEVLAQVSRTEDFDGLREGLPEWARGSLERIETTLGPRWIEWRHKQLFDPVTGECDIQTVGRDVTEQRRQERALAAARDEARAADRAKSRFLASMSHEIRTPMNGILGMSGLLSETGQSPEQRTYTDAIRKSAQTLLALIDEILDFSKIEAGHVELASKPVDLVECVQGVVELLAPRAYQKQLQLAWSIAPDMNRSYLGDETRLRQILLNLIGNAVKFTETGGISVWVGADQIENGRDRITVVIRDTGPGLSHEARSRIFMEFERAVPNGALHESGTGLGLAIAQRLARSMEGGISVNSTPGEGATFTLSVCLPRGTASPDGKPDAPLKLSCFGGRQVALVSPNIIERRTLANFLRAHNVAVSELRDVSELVMRASKTREFKPDAVLFDCTIEPAAARQALNGMGQPQNVCAAVIAATGNRAEIERFGAAGIENYLLRPIRPATLLALLAGEVRTRSTPSNLASVAGGEAQDAPPEGLAWRVLVAEDNEINALLARTILKRLGCEPVVVVNGREAIDQVRRSLTGNADPFQAILMDLQMPVVDGLEATAEIRSLCEAAGARAPAVIAVTANAFQEDRDRCLAAGMDDYLSKPFEPGDLKRVFDRIAINLAQR